MGEQKRLLLVEDDPQLGPIIADVLSETYETTLCTDGMDGLNAARLEDFDVLVVDRRLPSLDGTELVRTLRVERFSAPILMLTALGTTGDKVEGLDAGANDYLVKPFDFDELLARLRALTRVFNPECPQLSVGEWAFFPEENCIRSPHIGRILLTPRESQLLRLFAENPERTFSRHQILHGVFSPDDTPGTVDTYVHYLRRKTDKDVVLTVRGRGYRLGQL
ncbi:response regulator transcription factor [Microbacterium sp. STN6]|uniref:response regulator transcription factor n=1 Tax=Microbacterium sp. STN6 TaxID=2995588 RepID=UPI0022609D43|nr:response regulator transcription factor [Microbacterium sp. STN6]MCX7522907.1 response regulator transcription factor [Microbacterium sp. STN6]